jgi:hypothetical protein
MKNFLIICFFYLFSCSSAKKHVIQNEINGTVLNIENETVSNVDVKFYNDGDDFGFVPKSLKTDENGFFSVKEVKVKGDYQITNLLSEKLPSKIIFKKEGYLSDTIRIADYSNANKEELMKMNVILKRVINN